MEASQLVRRRRIIQWFLAPITIIVIALGWRFPFLGFAVPVVMITGLVGGILRGRYVCGHLCPRGSFFDRMLAPISPSKPIPPSFRSMALRWPLLVVLMGLMVYRISLNPGSIAHWGKVFWMMCVVTSAIGVILALFVNERSWCSFCPIGTLQNAVGGAKDQLRIDGDICRACRTCEKKCPLKIPIVDFKEDGVMAHRDCLKCPECVTICPKNALSFGSASASSGEAATEREYARVE